ARAHCEHDLRVLELEQELRYGPVPVAQRRKHEERLALYIVLLLSLALIDTGLNDFIRKTVVDTIGDCKIPKTIVGWHKWMERSKNNTPILSSVSIPPASTAVWLRPFRLPRPLNSRSV